MDTKRKTMKQKVSMLLVIVMVAFTAILAVSFGVIGNRRTTAEASIGNHDLFFLQMTPGEYSVGLANFAAQHISIPETHNGLPVREILSNGFAFSQVRTIYIPSSIRTIGFGAFMGSNLQFVNLGYVEKIEGFAFAMGNFLNVVALPETVTSIGSQAFMMTNAQIFTPLSPNDEQVNLGWELDATDQVIWNHAGAVTEFNLESETYTLIRYFAGSFINPNAVIMIEDHDDGNNGRHPFSEIRGGAFAGTVSNSINVGTQYPHHSINIMSSAFSGVLTNVIRLGNNVTFQDSDMNMATGGYSVSVFSGSTAHTVYLPNDIGHLPNGMFLNMFNLVNIRFNGMEETNILPTTVTRIGGSPINPNFGGQVFFAPPPMPPLLNQSVLTTNDILVIPYSVRYAGQVLFASTQRVHIDKYQSDVALAVEQNRWSAVWNQGGANVTFRLRVYLDAQGGFGDREFFNTRIGAYLPNNLNAPTRFGYRFNGFFRYPNGQGQQFFNSNMTVAFNEAWEGGIDRVYAHWTRYHTITFNYPRTSFSESVTIDCGNFVDEWDINNRILPNINVPQGYVLSWLRDNGDILTTAELKGIAINANMTFTAQVIREAARIFTVTFNWRCNTMNHTRYVEIEEGERLRNNQIPFVADTYTEGFSHWLINGRTYTNAQLTQRPITSNISAHAVMVINIRTINYIVNNQLWAIVSIRNNTTLSMNQIPRLNVAPGHHLVWVNGSVAYTPEQLSNRIITSNLTLVAMARENTFNLRFELGSRQPNGTFSPMLNARATIGQPFNTPAFTHGPMLIGTPPLNFIVEWYLDARLSQPVCTTNFQLPTASPHGGTVTLFARIREIPPIIIIQPPTSPGLIVVQNWQTAVIICPFLPPNSSVPWPWQWPPFQPDLLSGTITVRDANTGAILGTFNRASSTISLNAQSQFVVSNGTTQQVMPRGSVMLFS